MSKLTSTAIGLAAAICLLQLAMPTAHAQQADTTSVPLEPGAGVVVGLVVDTSMSPVEGAEVLVGGPDIRARTGPDGRFRLTGVEEGIHDVRVRRIGFAPASKRIRVGPDGARAIMIMTPAPPRLRRIVTSVDRLGLSGIVSDTAFRPLAGVDVTVFGAGAQRAVTDSGGGFFLPLQRGRYMLEFSVEGHRTRLVSVSIPADSGRWMAITLRVGSGPSNMERIELRNLRYRLAWRSMANSRVFVREDLVEWGSLPLDRIIEMGVGRPFHSHCEAFVDGGPERHPIWYFDLDELESVEVYEGHPGLPRIDRPAWAPPRWIGPPFIDERQGSGRDCPTVYVWLRR